MKKDFESLKENIYVVIDSQPVVAKLSRKDFLTLSLEIPILKYSGQTLLVKKKLPLDTLPNDSTITDSLSSPQRADSTNENTLKKASIPQKDITLLKCRLANSEHWGSLEIISKETDPSFNVILKKVRGNKEKEVVLISGKNNLIDSLIQGDYLVNYYHDKNKNGIWDSGSLKPWQSQEPKWVVQDTIHVLSSEKTSLILSHENE